MIEVDQFLETLEVVSQGGSVLDPLVVSQPCRQVPPTTPAKQLSERTAESHVTRIIQKLGIHVSAEDNRRVLAVLAYLQSRSH